MTTVCKHAVGNLYHVNEAPQGRCRGRQEAPFLIVLGAIHIDDSRHRSCETIEYAPFLPN
jgi:hypothetical protein